MLFGGDTSVVLCFVLEQTHEIEAATKQAAPTNRQQGQSETNNQIKNQKHYLESMSVFPSKHLLEALRFRWKVCQASLGILK